MGPADLPRLLQGQGGGQAQARLPVRLSLQSHCVSLIDAFPIKQSFGSGTGSIFLPKHGYFFRKCIKK